MNKNDLATPRLTMAQCQPHFFLKFPPENDDKCQKLFWRGNHQPLNPFAGGLGPSLDQFPGIYNAWASPVLCARTGI